MSQFYFQQFSVQQHHSAMKICTDSLLFGAMAPVKSGSSVLEIGAGNGFLSLMLAQLGAGQVTAVEIDTETYQEARYNFSVSPWASQLRPVNLDIQKFSHMATDTYDFIISNPPFFFKHVKSTDVKRKLARHNDALSYQDLIAVVNKLLKPRGLFYLLLPIIAIPTFTRLASLLGLHLFTQINFRSFTNKPSKVAAVSFSRIKVPCIPKHLIVYQSNGLYSTDSSLFLQPFLLRFAERHNCSSVTEN